MSRTRVIVTGLVGLAGAVILTGLCLFIVARGLVPILVVYPPYVWGLLLFLLFFSVVEIPMMIFSIRRIAASVNPKARYVALLVNAGYSFFGAVYAAPFILLTGRSGLGMALAALSIVRFLVALFFLPDKESRASAGSRPAWGR